MNRADPWRDHREGRVREAVERAMRAQQRQRLIVLGIGGGQMDAILIQAASNQFDSFVAAAMPIVTTFHFQ